MRAVSRAKPSPAPSGSGEKVVVLWVSRHEPVPIQLRVLREKLGDVAVVTLTGVIPNAEYVAEKAREVGARYVVPVLPLSFIARLAELAPSYGFTVLYSRMRLLAEAKKGDDRALGELLKAHAEAPDRRAIVEYADCYRLFEFERFEVLKRVEVVTEPW